MKKFTLACFLLLAIAVMAIAGTAGTAQAATVTLAWDAPTTWDDGSALTSASITGYNLYYGNVHSGPYPNKIAVGKVNTYSLTSVSSGTWYFVVTTLATNLTGSTVESGYSNEVTKIIDTRLPGAPKNATVVTVTQQ